MDFFLINVNQVQTIRGLMRASFNEIGGVETLMKVVIEYLVLHEEHSVDALVTFYHEVYTYFWQLLEQHLSNAKIASVL